jgi:hypothetical protein
MKIRALFLSASIVGALATGGAFAKAPAGSTGECKDGTYTQSSSREGACSSHGGVKTWMAANPAAATRPAGSTGECKDGTFTDAASKSGACSGHKGVKDWYGAANAPARAEPSASSRARTDATETVPRSTAASTGTGADRPVNPQPTARPTSMPSTPMAGGGNGKVWVNTNSHVYHCEKDALYGKTKKGEYMTESEAKSSGSRPSRGKTCA